MLRYRLIDNRTQFAFAISQNLLFLFQHSHGQFSGLQLLLYCSEFVWFCIELLVNVEQFFLLLFLKIRDGMQTNIVRLEGFNNCVESRLMMRMGKNCYLDIFSYLKLIGTGFFFVFLNVLKLWSEIRYWLRKRFLFLSWSFNSCFQFFFRIF